MSSKVKGSRANPMTPILRDLRVAVGRIEKVRDGLKKLELHQSSESAGEMVSDIDSLAMTIGEAWGDAAARRARQEVISAYNHPVQQPLPTTITEA